MIQVTRLDGSVIFINPHLIEIMEETPDTTVTYNGKKIVVHESAAEIVERIQAYRRSIGISVSDMEGYAQREHAKG